MPPRNFSKTVHSVKNTHRLNSTAVLSMKMVLLTLEVLTVPSIAGIKEVNSVSCSKLIKVIAPPSFALRTTWSLLVKISKLQSIQLKEVNLNSLDKLIAKFNTSPHPSIALMVRLFSVTIMVESLPSWWTVPIKPLSTPLIVMENPGVLRSFKSLVLSSPVEMITNSMRFPSPIKKFLDLELSGPLKTTTTVTHTPQTKSDVQLQLFLSTHLINKEEPFVIQDFMVTLLLVTTMVISQFSITTISERLLLSWKIQESGARPWNILQTINTLLLEGTMTLSTSTKLTQMETTLWTGRLNTCTHLPSRLLIGVEIQDSLKLLIKLTWNCITIASRMFTLKMDLQVWVIHPFGILLLANLVGKLWVSSQQELMVLISILLMLTLIEQELLLVMISVLFVSSSSHVPKFNKTAAESLVILSMFQESDSTRIQTELITVLQD